jgi:hypothetical protein
MDNKLKGKPEMCKTDNYSRLGQRGAVLKP